MIFELVDHTCYETYFSLGLFESLAKVNEAIDQSFARYSTPPHHWGNAESDSITLKIIERPFGMLNWEDCKTVETKNYRDVYDESKDDYVWELVE